MIPGEDVQVRTDNESRKRGGVQERTSVTRHLRATATTRFRLRASGDAPQTYQVETLGLIQVERVGEGVKDSV